MKGEAFSADRMAEVFLAYLFKNRAGRPTCAPPSVVAGFADPWRLKNQGQMVGIPHETTLL